MTHPDPQPQDEQRDIPAEVATKARRYVLISEVVGVLGVVAICSGISTFALNTDGTTAGYVIGGVLLALSLPAVGAAAILGQVGRAMQGRVI